MPWVAEVRTAPKAMAGARAAKKRKKTEAWMVRGRFGISGGGGWSVYSSPWRVVVARSASLAQQGAEFEPGFTTWQRPRGAGKMPSTAGRAPGHAGRGEPRERTDVEFEREVAYSDTFRARARGASCADLAESSRGNQRKIQGKNERVAHQGLGGDALLEVVKDEGGAGLDVVRDALEGGSMMGSALDSTAMATVAGATVRRTEKPEVDLPGTGMPKTDFLAATRAVGRAMPPRAMVFMDMAACILPVFFLKLKLRKVRRAVIMIVARSRPVVKRGSHNPILILPAVQSENIHQFHGLNLRRTGLAMSANWAAFR